MLTFEWIIGLLFVAVVLAGLARRIEAPYPTFLALGGAALGLSPFGPEITVEPELVLALFVAPILLDAAYDASPRDLKENWKPIAGLSLAAVGVTTIGVAVAARFLVPEMEWGVAIALGAIVAPPDAVSVKAALRQTPLPHRLKVILEGESLFNDASALLTYKLAVAAVAAGSFTAADLIPALFLVGIGSVAAGLALAFVFSKLTRDVEDVPSVIVLQFVATFGVWLLAEKLELSGIVTIVCYGLAVARNAPRRVGPHIRAPSFAVWETGAFVLSVLAFTLGGLQIRPIVDRLTNEEIVSYATFGGAVLAAVIVIRIVWVMAYNSVVRLKNHWFGMNLPRPMLAPSAKSGLIISWSGMRGVVTLAAGFGLPTDFPHRDLILFAAFAVVLGTLTIQGLTLRPLLNFLKLEDEGLVDQELRTARIAIVRAALSALDGETPHAAEALRRELKAALDAVERSEEGESLDVSPYDDLRAKMIAAQRDALMRLRSEGEIGDDAFRLIEEELDWAELNARPPAEAANSV